MYLLRVLIGSDVIGQSNYFGFGFTTLKKKPALLGYKVFQVLATKCSECSVLLFRHNLIFVSP